MTEPATLQPKAEAGFTAKLFASKSFLIGFLITTAIVA